MCSLYKHENLEPSIGKVQLIASYILFEIYRSFSKMKPNLLIHFSFSSCMLVGFLLDCRSSLLLLFKTPALSFLNVPPCSSTPQNSMDLVESGDFRGRCSLCYQQFPHECQCFVCFCVCVFFLLCQAQLNAVVCLLPAKSPLHSSANIHKTLWPFGTEHSLSACFLSCPLTSSQASPAKILEKRPFCVIVT